MNSNSSIRIECVDGPAMMADASTSARSNIPPYPTAFNPLANMVAVSRCVLHAQPNFPWSNQSEFSPR